MNTIRSLAIRSLSSAASTMRGHSLALEKDAQGSRSRPDASPSPFGDFVSIRSSRLATFRAAATLRRSYRTAPRRNGVSRTDRKRPRVGRNARLGRDNARPRRDRRSFHFRRTARLFATPRCSGGARSCTWSISPLTCVSNACFSTARRNPLRARSRPIVRDPRVRQ